MSARKNRVNKRPSQRRTGVAQHTNRRQKCLRITLLERVRPLAARGVEVHRPRHAITIALSDLAVYSCDFGAVRRLALVRKHSTGRTAPYHNLLSHHHSCQEWDMSMYVLTVITAARGPI